ncbi:MAG: hypothetical protein M1837_001053 [Sclerophora amabilis]|nr:MAG: hypothetical protein M1837_001053 [Sclerophora amabilis]
MANLPESHGELRVAIRYMTIEVPGLPHKRAERVAEDFTSRYLQRHFSYSEDFIHCPSDFDADNAKRVWILCDLNIREHIIQIERVPLQCWKVNYDQHGTALFTTRSVNVKHFTNQYPWGGRDNEWEYRQKRAKAVPSERAMETSPSKATQW